MKVLVTGAGGMLARALLNELGRHGHEVVPAARADLDVTDVDVVRRWLRREAPDAVVQCAAFTAVDAAEEQEETATLVNGTGAGNVAAACAEVGAAFLYPSTDYVFSGRERRPHRPDDLTAPINAYGRSKLAGERATLEAGDFTIVRTSWLYGEGGPNFVDTISRLAGEREALRVVDDQVGRPTSTATLARVIRLLLEKDARGVFHATDGGEPISWFEFAREIVRLQNLAAAVCPVPSSEFPRPARRPGYSVLDCSATEALTGLRLPDWKLSLEAYVSGRHDAFADGVAPKRGPG